MLNLEDRGALPEVFMKIIDPMGGEDADYNNLMSTHIYTPSLKSEMNIFNFHICLWTSWMDDP